MRDTFKSRKILKSEEIEEIKWNLEKDLKDLMHQTAKLMNIQVKSEEQVIEGLILDLQNITEQEHHLDFNKYLFIQDVKKELREKYLEELEPLKSFVSPGLEGEQFEDSYKIQEFMKSGEIRKRKDNFLNEEEDILQIKDHKPIKLRNFFNLISQEGFKIKADTGVGKTTLTK